MRAERFLRKMREATDFIEQESAGIGTNPTPTRTQPGICGGSSTTTTRKRAPNEG